MAASLTVFVCSTFSDLATERGAVLDAIRRLQLQHDSMEFFGARAEQPIETCLEEVRRSDILVVIVGHRYGTIAQDSGISFSEAEYAEGERLGKPCLVYMRDDNVPVLPKHIERDPEKLRLLERWRATLNERHTVATFETGHTLAVQVAADLSRTIHELEETAKARTEARTDTESNVIHEITQLLSDALERGVTEASLLTTIRRSITSLIPSKAAGEPTVFLSYARTDLEVVRAVSDGLAAAGIRVWLDESSIKPGSEWMQEIERELASADFVIFFISPDSVKSGWAKRELDIALHRQISGERGAVVIPVILEDADVPPLLRQFHWLDMRDKNINKGVARLAKDIRHWWVRRDG